MNFNAKQLDVINATEPKILCIAASSSGKTAVLTERIRQLIKKGVAPKDIVAITFTRLAAAEMRQRLEDVATDDMFIGTVHSYALKVCGLNDISMYKAIDAEKYDEILTTAAKLPASKYTPIKHLLIDEAQDLTTIEYYFINKIPTENIFYVGDTRQTIYSFRGGTDKFLVEKFHDPDYANYFLIQNYRNPPNILEFANGLIASHKKYGPESKTVKQEDGILRNRCTFTEALDAINDDKAWGTWAVLTRTNNEVDAVREELDRRGIDNITFKKADFDNPEQIEEAMRKNAVKVLTIHSMKGQEIPNVIVVGAKTFNAAERNLSYVAATRAKQSLYWCKPIPNLGRRKSITSINREAIENDDSMVEF